MSLPSNREVRELLLSNLLRSSSIRGEVSLPAAPSFTDGYVARFADSLDSLGAPLDPADLTRLRVALRDAALDLFAKDPSSTLLLRYEFGRGKFQFEIEGTAQSVAQQFDAWLRADEPAPFGAREDAFVRDVAARVRGEGARCLDVGAGVGRNALPLAALGFLVHAVEPSERLRAQLVTRAAAAEVTLHITSGYLEETELDDASYALVVVSEVTSHLADERALGAALTRLARALAPDGRIALNAFITTPEFRPDSFAREAALVRWSSLFTRAELDDACEAAGLAVVTEADALEYETAHGDPADWPDWYRAWAAGKDLLPLEAPPLRLRWFELARRA